MNLLNGLNESQREAVTSTAPVILTLAGAGSGKTRTLTHRIANLHLNHRVGTGSMLALTFTRLAGKEMKERIAGLIGEKETRGLFCNTFHSFAASVIRDNAKVALLERNFSIYDQDDRKAMLEVINMEFGKKTSVAKTEKFLEQLELDQVDNPELHEEYRVLKEYNYRLLRYNAADLDRLVSLARKILENDAEALAYYRKLYKYVFVDEFQDTSFDQMILLRTLSPENLFVVGDDFQAIYGWRGAKVEYIINFEKLYPSCTVFKLQDNYRSTRPIIAAANHLISNNVNQTKKTLIPHRDGDNVLPLTFEDQITEAQAVAKMAQIEHDAGIPWREIAVLARTNDQIHQMKRVMSALNIPAQIVSGSDDPLKKGDIPNIIHWMDVLSNNKDTLNLKKVFNFPKAYFTPTQLQMLEMAALAKDKSLYEVACDYPDAPQFVNDVKRIETSINNELAWMPQDAFRVLVNEFGLGDSYTSQGLTNRIRETEEAFLHIGRWEKTKMAMGEDISLSAFLKWVRYRDMQEKLFDNREAVKLMTVHASKGLEFHSVFVIGMVEDLFPSSQTSDMEEERRLFYVAITRAKEHLCLTLPESMEPQWGGRSFKTKPSRFLEELRL